MQTSVPAIAFIGLGNMGQPMAERLASAGFAVTGFDSHSAGDTSHTVSRAATLADSVSGAEIIITMLPEGQVVRQVIAEVLAILAQSPSASEICFVDCSTIDTREARDIDSLVRAAGHRFLDAPVSGGISGAAAGTLTAMVGGDEETLQQLQPVLEPMFARIIHCGAAGHGQAAKACNNMLLAVSMIGASEAFNLGQELGLDAAALFDVISVSSGSCWSVNNYCPVPGVGPASPADNGYTPGFSNRLMLKDLGLAQQAADSADVATPLGSHALQIYRALNEGGFADKDFSSVIAWLQALQRDVS